MAVSQTTRMKVHQWDAGTDPFTRSQMNVSFANLETYCAKIEKGSSRPAATSEYDRAFYIDTSGAVGKISFCDGSTWVDLPNIEPLVGSGGAVAGLVAAGSGVVGVSETAARSDHVHPAQTGTPVAVSTALAGGSSASFSRSDHVHILGTGALFSTSQVDSGMYATPTYTGTSNSAGASSTFARSDHIHAIGIGSINNSLMIASGVIDNMAHFGGGIRPSRSASSAPSSPSDGDLWNDTATDSLKRWNGSDWVWVGGKALATIIEYTDSTGLSIPDDEWTKGSGYSTILNTGGWVSSGTALVDLDGLYEVEIWAQWDAGAGNGYRRIGYAIGEGGTTPANRTTTFTNDGLPTKVISTIEGNTGDQYMAGRLMVPLLSGDRVTAIVKHEDGAALFLQGIRLGIHYLGASS